MPFYGGWDPSWRSPFDCAPADTGDEGHPYAAYRGDKPPWDGSDTGTKPYPMKLACLYVGRRYIGDAKVFYCPSNRNPTYQYESYIKPLAPNTNSDWGSLDQVYNQNAGINQWVRVGYTYYPIDETIKGPPQMEKIFGAWVPKYTARRYSLLSRKAPYLTDMIWSSSSISHKSGLDGKTGRPRNGGINALFKDGHVNYVRDQRVSYIYKDGSTVNNRTLLDNDYWEDWDPTGAEKPEGIVASFLFYHIYKMVTF
jgi:hypothetical protein